MDENNGFGKGLLIGLLTGAAVGTIIALLYAPKSGKELRGDIRRKGEDFIDEAENMFAKAKDKASQIINDGKKKSEKIVSDAKVKVDQLLDEAEKILADAKDKTGKYADIGKVQIEKQAVKLQSAINAGVEAYNTEKES